MSRNDDLSPRLAIAETGWLPTRLLALPLQHLFLLVGVVYVLLNVVDWWLTWRLVRLAGAYEANPLAARVLDRFGFTGLALFKLSLVAVVLGVSAFLWSRRPRTARMLLSTGCGAVLLVVAYSAWLWHEQNRPLEPEEWAMPVVSYASPSGPPATDTPSHRARGRFAHGKTDRKPAFQGRRPEAPPSPPDTLIAVE